MKTSQFYVEYGYEDVGYASPPLSAEDEYPEYIKQEVHECIARIQKHQSWDTLTFAFMTDLHYAMNENHEVRMKRTLNAYRELAARVQIDRLILGGDYVNEGCKEYKSACLRELRALLNGITYYPVNGNHDDGTIWDKYYIKSEKSVNHLTHEDMYRLFYNHLKAAGAQFDKKNPSLYYYYDDHSHKNRYIFLDTGDIPYIYDDSGKLLYDGQHYFAMSQKQIDWLINEALYFSEDGWSVIFFMHSVALPSKKEEELGILWEHMTVLNDVIECYHDGSCMCRDYYDGYFKIHLNVDFSQNVRGEIIALFAGDYHIDKVERSKSGIPYILTGNCVMYNPPGLLYSEGLASERKDGDKTELLYDVVTVDKKKRRIHLVRIGAGEDRTVEY